MRNIGKVVPVGSKFRLELRRRSEQRAAKALNLPYNVKPDPRCSRWDIYVLLYDTMARVEQNQRSIKHWIREETKAKLERRKKRRPSSESPWREGGLGE